MASKSTELFARIQNEAAEVLDLVTQAAAETGDLHQLMHIPDQCYLNGLLTGLRLATRDIAGARRLISLINENAPLVGDDSEDDKAMDAWLRIGQS